MAERGNGAAVMRIPGLGGAVEEARQHLQQATTNEAPFESTALRTARNVPRLSLVTARSLPSLALVRTVFQRLHL